jgi:hypothetical protein
MADSELSSGEAAIWTKDFPFQLAIRVMRLLNFDHRISRESISINAHALSQVRNSRLLVLS